MRFDDSKIDGFHDEISGAIFVKGRKATAIADLLLQNFDPDGSIKDGIETETLSAEKLTRLRDTFRRQVETNIRDQLSEKRNVLLHEALKSAKLHKSFDFFEDQAPKDFVPLMCQEEGIVGLRMLRLATKRCLKRAIVTDEILRSIRESIISILGNLVTLAVDDEWVYAHQNKSGLHLEIPLETAAGMTVAVARLNDSRAEFTLVDNFHIFSSSQPFSSPITESGWGIGFTASEIERATWKLLMPKIDPPIDMNEKDYETLNDTIAERRFDGVDHFVSIPGNILCPKIYDTLNQHLPALKIVTFGVKDETRVLLMRESQLTVLIREILVAVEEEFSLENS